MPGLVRKLLIYAAVDGLVLQPVAQRGQRPPTTTTIDYKTHSIKPLLHSSDQDQDKEKQLECYGIVGLLKVSSYAYLVTISRRQQVAQIFGKPVYVVTGVSVIPLGSQAEAQLAINHVKKSTKKNKDPKEQEDDDLVGDSDSDTLSLDGTLEDHHSVDSSKEIPEPRRGRPSVDLGEFGVAQNVIEKKGAYGRFTDKWFSKRGWTTGSRRNLGHDTSVELKEKSPLEDISEDNGDKKPKEDQPSSTPINEEQPAADNSPKDAAADLSSLEQERLTTSLIPKLVQTTKLLLGSRIFYYSYEQDLTNGDFAQRKVPLDIALYKQANPEYFWNQHLIMPFVEAGFTEYVLPLMQGFVGQREFVVEKAEPEADNAASTNDVQSGNSEEENKDAELVKVDGPKPAGEEEKAFLITLISRRSVKRSGLRYLRRGVDEDGNVANAAETEQILSTPDWDIEQGIQSFVQCRGSIPLFFSQIPYSFKPIPALHGTPEANQRAIKKHYSKLQTRYGNVHTVSLIDRHGTEPKIGIAFEDNVKQLNESGGINGKQVSFNWWEFHQKCRGMKFENVSQLVDETSDFLSTSSWTTSTHSQSGIIRTNCMDCLDRTNVVQSSFAQHILEEQLKTLGHPLSLTTNPTAHSWFNTLWADNGDAISRAYTGTSALKGDYTRTKKRNVLGALTDFSLTLSRYYQNLFEDFFAQAAIDYLLGLVDEAVFAEFEAQMTTADPAVDVRKARQSAIDLAASQVIEPTEDLISGWALASPSKPSSLRSWPFEETLLLLTERAAYVVRFDWATEKVRSFERILLERFIGIQFGTYITETHTKLQMDERRNVGMVIRYRVEPEDEGIKVFTRSLESNAEPAGTEGAEAETSQSQQAPAHAGAEGEVPIEQEASTSKPQDLPATTSSPTKPEPTKIKAKPTPAATTTTHFHAFKALPSRSSAVQPGSSTSSLSPQKSRPQTQDERDVIKQICADFERAVNANTAAAAPATSTVEAGAGAGSDHGDDGVAHAKDDAADVAAGASTTGTSEEVFSIIEGDIISLQEARKSTGYLETVGFKIKKLVWG